MLIDQEACVACGQCVLYCPVKAITLEDRAQIDYDECVECGNCLRWADCPVEAIKDEDLPYPRRIRAILSNPITIAPGSLIPGRGTEEMKTNDVSGRFPTGSVGINVEMGRPITGVRVYDIEKVTKAVAKLDVVFEPLNPITAIMDDLQAGTFKTEFLNEKLLSGIIELIVPLEKMAAVLKAIQEAVKDISAVCSVCVASRMAADGQVPIEPILKENGFWFAPNAKINVGLGRPFFKE